MNYTGGKFMTHNMTNKERKEAAFIVTPRLKLIDSIIMMRYYGKKGSDMNKFIFSVFVLFFAGIISIYSTENDNTNTDQNAAANTPKIFYLPMLSYSFISLGDIQAHNALGGLVLYRFNPDERDKLFSISLIYTPQALIDINPDFPNLYHTAALSITQKISRHTINGTFIAMTDKPVYGGLRTFMGMAGYSYDLIKGAHFSMALGIRLVVVDIGLLLDNGMPWLLWPLPSINLSWEYQWVNLSLIPGAKMTIAPKSPVSLIFKADANKYDASLWYRHFKEDGSPSTENMGIGIGIKRDSINGIRSDGWKYGISYNAVYGTFRILRFFEISGGWAFNGEEGYERVNWETLLESAGYSGNSMYSGNIGHGFFISTSIRMNL
jgi:hypothetical protein